MKKLIEALKLLLSTNQLENLSLEAWLEQIKGIVKVCPKELLAQLLPKIIFGENHYDPITDRILKKISSWLKELSYDEFFEELPSKEQSEMDLDALLSGMDEEKFYIINKYIFNNTLKPEKAEKKDSYSETVKVCHAESQEAYIHFRKTLEEHKITYTPVDAPETKFWSYEKYVSDEGIATRDKFMAAQYVKKPLIFGRVGFDHFKGLQRNIAGAYDDRDYLFVSVCNRSVSPKLAKKILSCNYDPRDYPYGITALDATQLTEDEILKVFLKKIIEVIIRRYELNASQEIYLYFKKKQEKHEIYLIEDKPKSDLSFLDVLLKKKKELDQTITKIDKDSSIESKKSSSKPKANRSFVIGRTDHEAKLIDTYATFALKNKLIKESDVYNLKYPIATVTYAFNNPYGLIALCLKLITLQDLDGVSISVLTHLMTAEGLTYLKYASVAQDYASARGAAPLVVSTVKQAEQLGFEKFKQTLESYKDSKACKEFKQQAERISDFVQKEQEEKDSAASSKLKPEKLEPVILEPAEPKAYQTYTP